MKKTIIVIAILYSMIACKNNASSEANANEPKKTSGSNAVVDKSALYGKWYFKNATVKMTGAKGELIMNDTIQGSPTDYFLINADGTSESHIGSMVDKSKYKFINDNELITDDPTNKDKASLKIVSISASLCTLSLNQKKEEGNMDMVMYLKK
jgi:hypothetical protein